MSDNDKALTEGELWSLFRSIMSQGADIRCDYDQGAHKGYEAYSARLDAAAAERQSEFWAAHIAPLHAECDRLKVALRLIAEAQTSVLGFAYCNGVARAAIHVARKEQA